LIIEDFSFSRNDKLKIDLKTVRTVDYDIIKKIWWYRRRNFSNYEYHNLGVPINQAVRKANGKGADFIDHGLLDNPKITDKSQDGKFKVPTLRNVAITGDYMHNGVFKELKTVILFYDKFNNPKHNPETGKPWAKPEVDNNIALKTKEFKAPALTDKKVDALVAFLKTLTDKRYEHFLD
jgi:cytochrome c peroxidase